MIRILLAEDMRMVRGALVALLALEEDIEVLAEVESGDAIVPTALKCRPDVAVIDVDLPGVDGLTAAAELHERLPGCRTLIVTSLGKAGTLRRALEVRVDGFILKDAPPAELAEAIRKVAAGQRVVDQQLMLTAWETAENPLTPREAEVLRLAAQGHDVPEIAKRLFLSAGTVRNYLTASVFKLNARNRVDAIRIAHDAGWL
jgi:two-component system response regulator DesR